MKGRRREGWALQCPVKLTRAQRRSLVAALRFCTPLSILVLGDATRPEFREARACLARWGSVVEFSDADSAAAALAEDRFSPDVIVVAQAFPGQFSHEAIDRLRRLAPLGPRARPDGKLVRRGDAERLALAGDGADLLASMARPLRPAVSPLGDGPAVFLGAASDGHRGRAAAGRCRPVVRVRQRVPLLGTSSAGGRLPVRHCLFQAVAHSLRFARIRARWPIGCRRPAAAADLSRSGSATRPSLAWKERRRRFSTARTFATTNATRCAGLSSHCGPLR